MTRNEIAVIVFGVFAGYWVVAKLFFRPPPADTAPAIDPLPGAAQWYDILQVPASASPAEIREAYKHLISKYHPDKVASLGQELIDLAGKKSQEIIAAYQQGMRLRGEVP
jgi:DnaJ like chaperone protein